MRSDLQWCGVARQVFLGARVEAKMKDLGIRTLADPYRLYRIRGEMSAPDGYVATLPIRRT